MKRRAKEFAALRFQLGISNRGVPRAVRPRDAL